MLGGVELAERHFVVVAIVQHIVQVGVERVNVVELEKIRGYFQASR